MDIFDDEEEVKCENQYINFFRKKRDIIGQLWEEYKSNWFQDEETTENEEE